MCVLAFCRAIEKTFRIHLLVCFVVLGNLGTALYSMPINLLLALLRFTHSLTSNASLQIKQLTWERCSSKNVVLFYNFPHMHT